MKEDGTLKGVFSSLFSPQSLLLHNAVRGIPPGTTRTHTIMRDNLVPSRYIWVLVRTEADGTKTILDDDVTTLNDLTGFVTIGTKHDAIEYLRLASSWGRPLFSDYTRKEIFCVPDTHSNLLHYQATVSQFKIFGFETPKVTASVGGMVNMCHFSVEHPKKEFTLRVDTSQMMAHLSHGDRFGLCEKDKKIKIEGSVTPRIKELVDKIVEMFEERIYEKEKVVIKIKTEKKGKVDEEIKKCVLLPVEEVVYHDLLQQLVDYPDKIKISLKLKGARVDQFDDDEISDESNETQIRKRTKERPTMDSAVKTDPRIFLVIRTVWAPLEPGAGGAFLRSIEEVHPNGEWRLIKQEKISDLTDDNFSVLFR